MNEEAGSRNSEAGAAARRLIGLGAFFVAGAVPLERWNRMGPTARLFPAACLGLGVALLLRAELRRPPSP